MPANDNIPVAVWSGSFTLGGVKMKCYVLDDGQRIIDADSIAALFEAMAEPDFAPAAAEMEEFSRWQRGLPKVS